MSTTVGASMMSGGTGARSQKMAGRPAASVKVIYDYAYTNEQGRAIQIEKGQIFDLLERTNNEWWKLVDKVGQQFFAPANYVRELPGETMSTSNINFLSLVNISANPKGSASPVAKARSTSPRPDGSPSRGSPVTTRRADVVSRRPNRGLGLRAADSRTASVYHSKEREEPAMSRGRSGSDSAMEALINQAMTVPDQTVQIVDPAASDTVSIQSDERGMVTRVVLGEKQVDDDDKRGDERLFSGYQRGGYPGQHVAGDSFAVQPADAIQHHHSPASTPGQSQPLPVGTGAADGIPRLTVTPAFDANAGSHAVGGNEDQTKTFAAGMPSHSMSSMDSLASIEEQPTYANMADINSASVSSLNLKQSEERGEEPSSKSAPNPEINANIWEAVTDEKTERVYYYNTVTQETRWDKPEDGPTEGSGPEESQGMRSPSPLPGATDAFEESGTALGDDEEEPASGLGLGPKRSLSRLKSLKKGWTEVVLEDQSHYVHNATGDKWYSAKDATGKQYYYNEDTQESVWELPEGGMSRRVILATNSVDRDKKGFLNVKVAEGPKKKFKKSWLVAYAVSQGPKLFIYKGDKNSADKPQEALGPPEATVDMSDATINWATKDVSSKKNTLLVICPKAASDFLLQHDDTLAAHQWHTILSNKIKRFKVKPPSTLDPAPAIEEPPITNDSSSSLKGAKSPTGKPENSGKSFKSSASVKHRHFKSGSGKEGYDLSPTAGSPAGPPVENTNRLGIREKLKNFLSKRPSQQDLEAKGILKEATFNSHLQFLCNRESATVPRFVRNCIEAIEAKGIAADGVYRVSGNLSQITKLRYEVDQSTNGKYDLMHWDVHVLAGALKLFFRELKEPLIPYDHYQPLLNAVADKDMSSRLAQMKMLIRTMPAPNRDTLSLLMAHLSNVCAQSHENRMQPQNVAIVFGPTLMRSLDDVSSVTTSLMTQNLVIESFLKNFSLLF